jgi:hypothetical protein
MAIKSYEEIEARKTFINDADKVMVKAQQESILSDSGLNKMSNDDLINRLIQIDNQATLMKWRIWWVLRQRYESNILFGKFIEELGEDSIRALCPNNTREIHRSHTAGKFCELHGINDLSTIGLSQTVIYELSRPVNESIAGEVFKIIKNQKTQVKEVKRLLDKARSIEPDVLGRDNKMVDVSDKEPNTEVNSYLYDEPESNVEVIDYKEVDSVIEVANEEDDDAFEEFVKTIKTHHLSSSSVRALIRRLNKLLEEM